jgi:hypothetical protein
VRIDFSSGEGAPASFALRSSADGYAGNLAVITVGTGVQSAVVNLDSLAVVGPVTFVLVPLGTLTGESDFFIQRLEITSFTPGYSQLAPLHVAWDFDPARLDLPTILVPHLPPRLDAAKSVRPRAALFNFGLASDEEIPALALAAAGEEPQVEGDAEVPTDEPAPRHEGTETETKADSAAKNAESAKKQTS